MDYQIKVLSGADWEEYKTIQLEALQEDPQAFGSKYIDWINATPEKWQERPSNPDTILLVAEDGVRAIGMVGIHMEIDGESGKVGHIWGMFVSKEYRGKGVGKMLMQDIIQRTKALPDVEKISLMVNPEQQTAIGLYEALGFRKTGTKEWVLGDGVSHDLLIMELDTTSFS